MSKAEWKREGPREGKAGGMNEGIKGREEREREKRVKSFHCLQLLIFVLTQNFWNFIVLFLNIVTWQKTFQGVIRHKLV